MPVGLKYSLQLIVWLPYLLIGIPYFSPQLSNSHLSSLVVKRLYLARTAVNVDAPLRNWALRRSEIEPLYEVR